MYQQGSVLELAHLVRLLGREECDRPTTYGGLRREVCWFLVRVGLDSIFTPFESKNIIIINPIETSVHTVVYILYFLSHF